MIELPPIEAWLTPTMHPAALLRSMKMQHAVISDLKKGVRIHKEGGLRYIPKEEKLHGAMPTWATHPTLTDVERFVTKFYRKRVAADFEATLRRVPWCVAFWPVDTWLEDQGLCVPIRCRGGAKYWSPSDWIEVERLIRPIFEDPQWGVIGQNFVGYDVYLVRDVLGWECNGPHPDMPIEQDTMVSAHEAFAELPQSLAFQSSMVTDMGPYKLEVKERETAEDDEDEDDTVKGIENVAEIDDTKLRTYCLRDTFATAGAGLKNERMMA